MTHEECIRCFSCLFCKSGYLSVDSMLCTLSHFLWSAVGLLGRFWKFCDARGIEPSGEELGAHCFVTAQGFVGGPQSVAVDHVAGDQTSARACALRKCEICSVAGISSALSVWRSAWKLPFASWVLTLLCRNWEGIWCNIPDLKIESLNGKLQEKISSDYYLCASKTLPLRNAS